MRMPGKFQMRRGGKIETRLRGNVDANMHKQVAPFIDIGPVKSRAVNHETARTSASAIAPGIDIHTTRPRQWHRPDHSATLMFFPEGQVRVFLPSSPFLGALAYIRERRVGLSV